MDGWMDGRTDQFYLTGIIIIIIIIIIDLYSAVMS